LDDEELFLFEMAFNLRMTVHELMNMSYIEFIGWRYYFERRPIGWRDDDRTYKLLQAQGVKHKPDAVFSSLIPIYNSISENDKLKGLKSSAMYKFMLGASGGESLEILKEI
jgi:hypothetical protein